MKITNKTRYKSMKKSSPLAQYLRFIRGNHYQNRKNIVVPKAVIEKIKKTLENTIIYGVESRKIERHK